MLRTAFALSMAVVLFTCMAVSRPVLAAADVQNVNVGGGGGQDVVFNSNNSALTLNVNAVPAGATVTGAIASQRGPVNWQGPNPASGALIVFDGLSALNKPNNENQNWTVAQFNGLYSGPGVAPGNAVAYTVDAYQISVIIQELTARLPNPRAEAGRINSNGTFGPPLNLGGAGVLQLELGALQQEFDGVTKAPTAVAFPNWRDGTLVQGKAGRALLGSKVTAKITYTFTTTRGTVIEASDSSENEFQ